MSQNQLYENKTIDVEEFADVWGEMLKYYRKHLSKGKWLFRGDNPAKQSFGKSFESRIEKAFADFGIEDSGKKTKIETNLIREFRRKEHLYTNSKGGYWLESLALMQHHEAPTRFLDWTYSFFAALYFAVNRASKGSCVIWALSNDWLAKQNEEFENEFIKEITDPQNFNDEYCRDVKKTWHPHFENIENAEYFRNTNTNYFQNVIIHHLIKSNPKSLVYATNPYSLNKRLAIQQGVLLCPGNLQNKLWAQNLKEMIKHGSAAKKPLCRIVVYWRDEHSIQNEILRELYNMNINQMSLFPDLDGFAKSLRTRVAYPSSLGV